MANVELDYEEGDILHDNDNYIVVLDDLVEPSLVGSYTYVEGYLVISKVTGVVEYQSNQYPDAVTASEHLDLAMTNKHWEWIRAQAEAVDEAAS